MPPKRVWLTRLRLRTNLSHEQLAARLGVDPKTVGTGSAAPTSPRPAQRGPLAEPLGVARAELADLLERAVEVRARIVDLAGETATAELDARLRAA